MYVLAFVAAFINVYASLGICMALWIYWAVIMKIKGEAT